jgi:hypothetical protein
MWVVRYTHSSRQGWQNGEAVEAGIAAYRGREEGDNFNVVPAHCWTKFKNNEKATELQYWGNPSSLNVRLMIVQAWYLFTVFPAVPHVAVLDSLTIHRGPKAQHIPAVVRSSESTWAGEKPASDPARSSIPGLLRILVTRLFPGLVGEPWQLDV